MSGICLRSACPAGRGSKSPVVGAMQRQGWGQWPHPCSCLPRQSAFRDLAVGRSLCRDADWRCTLRHLEERRHKYSRSRTGVICHVHMSVSGIDECGSSPVAVASAALGRQVGQLTFNDGDEHRSMVGMPRNLPTWLHCDLIRHDVRQVGGLDHVGTVSIHLKTDLHRRVVSEGRSGR